MSISAKNVRDFTSFLKNEPFFTKNSKISIA